MVIHVTHWWLRKRQPFLRVLHFCLVAIVTYYWFCWNFTAKTVLIITQISNNHNVNGSPSGVIVPAQASMVALVGTSDVEYNTEMCYSLHTGAVVFFTSDSKAQCQKSFFMLIGIFLRKHCNHIDSLKYFISLFSFLLLKPHQFCLIPFCPMSFQLISYFTFLIDL